MEITISNLENLLSKHDWYYHFSDDYKIYKKGKSEEMTIINMMSLLRKGNEKQVNELFNKYQKRG